MLLKRTKDAPSQGVFYLGEGFGSTSGKGKSKFSEPDSNGKTYFWYTLIKQGKHEGKYTLGLSVIKNSKYRNSKQDAEALDIYESGFEIHAPGPFQNSN